MFSTQSTPQQKHGRGLWLAAQDFSVEQHTSETPAQFRGRASEKGSGSPWEGGSCRSPPKSRRGPSSAHHCALPAPELPVVIRSIVSRPWQHNGPWDFQTRLHSLEAGTEAAGMGIRVVIQKGRQLWPQTSRRRSPGGR